MNSLEKFKLAIRNEEFKNKFSSVRNIDEALKIAKSNGYDLNKDEVLRDNELREDMLDAVAGGKEAEVEEINHTTITSGKNSHTYVRYDTSLKWANAKGGFVMNSIDEFKRRIKDDDTFKKYFKDAKSTEDVIKIARQEGYDLTKCTEQEEAQLKEDMLMNIAGGSKTKKVKIAQASAITIGDDSSTFLTGEIKL